MKIDYLMITEAGKVLAEELENKADENMERCALYAGEADKDGAKMQNESGSAK